MPHARERRPSLKGVVGPRGTMACLTALLLVALLLVGSAVAGGASPVSPSSPKATGVRGPSPAAGAPQGSAASPSTLTRSSAPRFASARPSISSGLNLSDFTTVLNLTTSGATAFPNAGLSTTLQLEQPDDAPFVVYAWEELAAGWGAGVGVWEGAAGNASYPFFLLDTPTGSTLVVGSGLPLTGPLQAGAPVALNLTFHGDTLSFRADGSPIAGNGSNGTEAVPFASASGPVAPHFTLALGDPASASWPRFDLREVLAIDLTNGWELLPGGFVGYSPAPYGAPPVQGALQDPLLGPDHVEFNASFPAQTNGSLLWGATWLPRLELSGRGLPSSVYPEENWSLMLWANSTSGPIAPSALYVALPSLAQLDGFAQPLPSGALQLNLTLASSLGGGPGVLLVFQVATLGFSPTDLNLSTPLSSGALSASLLPVALESGEQTILWVRLTAADSGVVVSTASVRMIEGNGTSLKGVGYSASEAAYGFQFTAPIVELAVNVSLDFLAQAPGFNTEFHALLVQVQPITFGGSLLPTLDRVLSGSETTIDLWLVDESLNPLTGATVTNYSWCSPTSCNYPIEAPLTQDMPRPGFYQFTVNTPLVVGVVNMTISINVTCPGHLFHSDDNITGVLELVGAPMQVRALAPQLLASNVAGEYLLGYAVSAKGTPLANASIDVNASGGSPQFQEIFTDAQGEAWLPWTAPTFASGTYFFNLTVRKLGYEVLNATTRLEVNLTAAAAPASSPPYLVWAAGGAVAVALAALATWQFRGRLFRPPRSVRAPGRLPGCASSGSAGRTRSPLTPTRAPSAPEPSSQVSGSPSGPRRASEGS